MVTEHKTNKYLKPYSGAWVKVTHVIPAQLFVELEPILYVLFILGLADKSAYNMIGRDDI